MEACRIIPLRCWCSQRREVAVGSSWIRSESSAAAASLERWDATAPFRPSRAPSLWCSWQVSTGMQVTPCGYGCGAARPHPDRATPQPAGERVTHEPLLMLTPVQARNRPDGRPLEARQNDWRTQTCACVFIATRRINSSQSLCEDARRIWTRKQTLFTEEMCGSD